jgi:protein-tyrosine phosphatase
VRSILFVCTANICRSPSSEAVVRKLLGKAAAEKQIQLDSAGVQVIKAGMPPFPTAVDVAKKRGYDLTHLASRQVTGADFDHFDLILGMDLSHLRRLRAMAPTRCKHKIELFLEYGDKFHGEEIHDPYGGKVKEYEHALDRIEDGARGLVQLLAR